jgi:hypothetical protein
LGSNKIWIAVGAVAIVVLGGWFFMSRNDNADGAISEPAAIEGSDTVEDQDMDDDEEDATGADEDDN